MLWMCICDLLMYVVCCVAAFLQNEYLIVQSGSSTEHPVRWGTLDIEMTRHYRACPSEKEVCAFTLACSAPVLQHFCCACHCAACCLLCCHPDAAPSSITLLCRKFTAVCTLLCQVAPPSKASLPSNAAFKTAAFVKLLAPTVLVKVAGTSEQVILVPAISASSLSPPRSL